MSFSGATNSSGSTTFSKSQIQGETKAFTGALAPKVRQQLQRQRMMEDEQLQRDIKKGQLDLIDEFINQTMGEPDEALQKKLEDNLNTLLLTQMLQKDIVVEDADTYYRLLEDYDRQAEFEDVDEYASRVQEQVKENFLGDLNDFFDGVGKIDALEASGAIENIGEATTDIIEAIVDKNPKYGAIAVAELLGVEFDQEGNFSLKNTISDNARPLIQKIMARYVVRPLKNLFGSFGATTEEVEAHLEPLLQEVAEEEAGFLEATLGEELTALAETETLALPGLIIGGLQGGTAILRAIGGVLQAINLSHDAYTKKNHTWADQNSGFIKFVKKIPLINELAESIADLVAEAKDMRAYRRGETDAQQFQKEYSQRQNERSEEEAVLNFLTTGVITYDDIRQGKKFSYYKTVGRSGEKTIATIDLSKYRLEDLKDNLADDIDALKRDGTSELNNLISFYQGETETMLDNIPKSLRDTLQFRNNEIVGWDPRRVADMKRTIKSKRLGDILFRGGQRDVPITQEEFLSYVRNYNDYIQATQEATQQKEKLNKMG